MRVQGATLCAVQDKVSEDRSTLCSFIYCGIPTGMVVIVAVRAQGATLCVVHVRARRGWTGQTSLKSTAVHVVLRSKHLRIKCNRFIQIRHRQSEMTYPFNKRTHSIIRPYSLQIHKSLRASCGYSSLVPVAAEYRLRASVVKISG